MAQIGQSNEVVAQATPAHIDSSNQGKMNYLYFSYTHSGGAGTGTIPLRKLPAGKIKVFPSLSRCITSAFAATSDIHIGHQAYVKPDGTTEAADDNEWLDNGDAASGIDVAFGLPALPTEYNSRDGIMVEAMVDTANIEDTDTIHGWIAYLQN